MLSTIFCTGRRSDESRTLGLIVYILNIVAVCLLCRHIPRVECRDRNSKLFVSSHSSAKMCPIEKNDPCTGTAATSTPSDPMVVAKASNRLCRLSRCMMPYHGFCTARVFPDAGGQNPVVIPSRERAVASLFWKRCSRFGIRSCSVSHHQHHIESEEYSQLPHSY